MANPIDINSELDEMDREEFYRLKKVRFVVGKIVCNVLTMARLRTKSREILPLPTQRWQQRQQRQIVMNQSTRQISSALRKTQT